MAATILTERFCPHHGRFVRLADCDIVATTDYTTELRQRLGRELPAVHGRRSGKERSQLVKPDLGALFAQWRKANEDYEKAVKARSFLRRGPETPIPPDLPSPEELAKDVGGAMGRPRRACPECREPFPLGIDEHGTFTVAVVGPMGSKKSTFLGQLYNLAYRRGAAPTLGLTAMRPVEGETDGIRELGRAVRKGEYPKQTTRATDWYAPSVFEVSTTHEDGLLYLFDVAGEHCTDPAAADFFLPFLGWADAIVVLIDPGRLRPELLSRTTSPEPIDAWGSDEKEEDDVDEGEMIAGLIQRLRSSGNTDCPIAVVLAAADALAGEPDLDFELAALRNLPGADGESSAVRLLLERLDGGHIIQAADSWDHVSYHAMAALPSPKVPDRSPFGVLEVMASVLRRTELFG